VGCVVKGFGVDRFDTFRLTNGRDLERFWSARVSQRTAKPNVINVMIIFLRVIFFKFLKYNTIIITKKWKKKKKIFFCDRYKKSAPTMKWQTHDAAGHPLWK
jgi:hypothetical protein